VPVPLPLLQVLARLATAVGAPFPLDPKQLARASRDKRPVGATPPGWSPTIPLGIGLARLAAEMGLGPSLDARPARP
jgi:hypothetical protein